MAWRLRVECVNGLEGEQGEDQEHGRVAESVEGELRQREVVAHHAAIGDREQVVGQVVSH